MRKIAVTALFLCPKEGDSMFDSTLMQSLGWTDERLITLAIEAAHHLSSFGLQREAVLVWLDQVAAHPARFLGDPALAPLAEAYVELSLVEETTLCVYPTAP
jgi:hypothetical protein